MASPSRHRRGSDGAGGRRVAAGWGQGQTRGVRPSVCWASPPGAGISPLFFLLLFFPIYFPLYKPTLKPPCRPMALCVWKLLGEGRAQGAPRVGAASPCWQPRPPGSPRPLPEACVPRKRPQKLSRQQVWQEGKLRPGTGLFLSSGRSPRS